MTQPNTNFINQWLDACEQQLVHPGVVEARLESNGWPTFEARRISEMYRRRFNEHTLGYSALFIATGVAALAAGTAGHTLVSGLYGPVNRNTLAFWLSIFICVIPFAAWAHSWAARVDRDDVVAVWSRPRRQMAQALIWACGIVGGVRLLDYAVRLVGSLIHARWAHGYSLGAGALNVTIAIGIALPLGLWAYGFLHRFDHEDPTAPPSQRRRPAAPAPSEPRTYTPPAPPAPPVQPSTALPLF